MKEGMLFGSPNLLEPTPAANTVFWPFDNIAFLQLSSCFVAGVPPS